MELTAGQQKGLGMVRRLVASPSHQVAILAGYAGTGKTFLLKTIAETCGMPVIVAPTGKAAARVTEMAGLPSMTVHRWLYTPITDPDTGDCTFTRKLPNEMPCGSIGLLVVEEASMVSRDLWGDILDAAKTLQLKVLLMGDPFQLSPVEPDERYRSFSCLDPDVSGACEATVLTEIQRQALDNPIIRASMLVREGDVEGALGLLPLVPSSRFIEKAAEVQRSGGMTLCHKNVTRHWANNGIRRHLGFTDDIQAGEPVVVLKNNYQLGAYNGNTYQFGKWLDLTPSKHTVYDRRNKVRETTRFGTANLRDPLSDTPFRAVLAQEELFGRMRASQHAIAQAADISFRDEPMLHVNLGYCLTCHKAQGSESPIVLVALEPNLRFWGNKKDDALRWLYTAVSRAKSTCYISMGATAPNVLDSTNTVRL